VRVDAVTAQRKHPPHVFIVVGAVIVVITVIAVITVVGVGIFAMSVSIGVDCFVERTHGTCFFDNAAPLHHLMRVGVC